MSEHIKFFNFKFRNYSKKTMEAEYTAGRIQLANLCSPKSPNFMTQNSSFPFKLVRKLFDPPKEPYTEEPVPVKKMMYTKQRINLNQRVNLQRQLKKKQYFAEGFLYDNKKTIEFPGNLLFKANFNGSFYHEKDQIIYFEGNIQDINISKINDNQLTKQQGEQFSHIKIIKGFFKGKFISEKQKQDKLSRYFTSKNSKPKTSIFERLLQINPKRQKTEYFLPTFVGFKIKNINKISLKQSMANLDAIFIIQILFNNEILQIIQDLGRKNIFHDIGIGFNRDKPIQVPFYDPQSATNNDDSEQQWDDGGDQDVEAQWNHKLCKVSYKVRKSINAQIDNSHGLFFAPFNLNILKIIVNFHSIKLSQTKKINFTVCDLHDFNNSRKYTPYTFFNDLKVDKFQKQSKQKYKRHFQRMIKICINDNFNQRGQYHIADNRMCLFPYHRRIIKNKASNTESSEWGLGIASRTQNLQNPDVCTIKQSYEKIQRGQLGQHSFKLQYWDYCHIEIPTYKHPTVEMGKIFIPLLLLSLLSLLLFQQQNGIDHNERSLLGSRIGVACGITLGYVAMIPLIRQNLPPSPNITLIQILIYLSTIPNYMAILGSVVIKNISYDEWFKKYKPFQDFFFLFSFILIIFILITILIIVAVYAKMDYKANFRAPIQQRSIQKEMRAPLYLKFMGEVQKKRTDIKIQDCYWGFNFEEKKQEKKTKIIEVREKMRK